MFRWDNARNEAKDHYDQRDKVWSIKTDGTDLRLVADEFVGKVRLMRVSPNNRYLALAYSASEGMFKVIKDLKTGEYIELGRSRGYPEFLWAEDSSYLYYVDKFKDWKYTLATGEKEETEVNFNEYSVIYNGKRIVVVAYGVAVFDEQTNELLYSVAPKKEEVIWMPRSSVRKQLAQQDVMFGQKPERTVILLTLKIEPSSRKKLFQER